MTIVFDDDLVLSLFELLFESAEEIIVLTDNFGKTLYFNDYTKKILGEKLNYEISCDKIFNCQNLSKIPQFCPIIELQSFPKTENLTLYSQIENQNFQLNCTPIYGNDGKLKYIFHSAKNIQEQIARELHLKKISRMLSILRNFNQFVYLEKDPKLITENLCEFFIKEFGFVLAIFISLDAELFGKNYTIFKTSNFENEKQLSKIKQEAYTTKLIEEFNQKIHSIDFKKLKKDKFVEWCIQIDDDTIQGIISPIGIQNKIIGLFGAFSIQPVKFTQDEKNLLIELFSDLSVVFNTIQTEQRKRQADQELERLRRFFVTLMNNLPGFIYRCKNDPNWTMEYLSDNFTKITGYSVDEVIGNRVISFNDLIHPQHRDRLWVKWQDLLRRKEPFQDEYPIFTKNGELRWVYEQGCGVFDENGKLEALEGYIFDITDRKLLEEKLTESEKRFRAIFEASSDAIFVMAGDVFIDCNVSAMELFEGNRSQIVGKTPYELSPEFQPDGQRSQKKALEYIKRALRGEILRFEWTHKTVTNKIIHTEVSLNSIKVGEKIYILALVRDISELKRLYNELSKIFQALDSSEQAILITDTNNIITYINKGFEKTYGYKKNEIIGKDISIIRPKDIPTPSLDEMRQQLLAGKSFTCELKNIRKNGEIFDIILTANPVFDQQNNIISFVGAAADISNLKRIEEEFIKSKEEFQNLVNSLEDIVYTLDLNHRHTNVFGRWVEGYGLTKDYFLGKTAIEILGPEEGKIHIEMQNKCISQKKSIVFEWSRELNNRRYYFQTRISPVFGKDGNVIGIIGIGRDITSLVEAEIELKKFQIFLNNSPVAFLVLNTNYEIIFANKKFFELTHFTTEDVFSKNFFEIHRNQESRIKEIFNEINTKNFWKGEIPHPTKDNMIFYANITISHLTDSNNNIINYLIIMEDITERKKLLDKLLHSKKQAEELSALKSYLLMNFSHEFRTPLNSILGFAQLLTERTKDNEIRGIANIIYQSGFRLLNTLNLVIDYSRIEVGLLSVKPNEFDLIEVVKEILFTQQKLNEGKQLETQFKSDFETLVLFQDEFMVRSIVYQIINNAFKFTKEGSINVIINNQTEAEGTEIIEIKVFDTGIGIAKEHQELIWKEFYQVSQGLSREFEGSGLGLTVAKKFAQTLGGDITVESELGKGSTFTIHLPRKYVEQNNKGGNETKNTNN